MKWRSGLRIGGTTSICSRGKRNRLQYSARQRHYHPEHPACEEGDSGSVEEPRNVSPFRRMTRALYLKVTSNAEYNLYTYKRVMRIKMAPGSHILSGLWLDCRGHLAIGENSVINQRCRLDARGGLIIGANVSISPEVHILSADHDVSSIDFSGRTR